MTAIQAGRLARQPRRHADREGPAVAFDGEDGLALA